MDEERKRQPRGPGRPKLPPNQVKRHTIAIRTTEDLVSRLKSASKASGRSLAREIEHRLQQSLVEEDVSGRIAAPLNELTRTLAEVRDDIARVNRAISAALRHSAAEWALHLAEKPVSLSRRTIPSPQMHPNPPPNRAAIIEQAEAQLAETNELVQRLRGDPSKAE
jgi:hypothetical protein